MKYLTIAAVIMFLGITFAYADSLQCPGGEILVGDSISTVNRYCGKPYTMYMKDNLVVLGYLGNGTVSLVLTEDGIVTNITN